MKLRHGESELLARRVGVQDAGLIRMMRRNSHVRSAVEKVRNHPEIREYFDENVYLAAYPDVAKSGHDGLTHYLLHGESEQRRSFGRSSFWAQNYWEDHPDVHSVGMSALAHFILQGLAEGRVARPMGLSAATFPVRANSSLRVWGQCGDVAETECGYSGQHLVMSVGPWRVFELEHRAVPTPSQTWVSVVTPLFKPRLDHLISLSEAIRAQDYDQWEWLLVDDGIEPEIQTWLEWLMAEDPRIVLLQGSGHGGISHATNAALSAATGTLVSFVDQDDYLTADALRIVASAFDIVDDLDVLYTDEFKFEDASGPSGPTQPILKPAWSPLLARSVMYPGHLLTIRRSTLGLLRLQSKFDGLQDFDFLLRASGEARAIGHLSDALYGWRVHAGSTASRPDSKSKTLRALQEASVSEQVRVEESPFEWVPKPFVQHRLEPRLRAGVTLPRISVVVPSKDHAADLERCLRSVRLMSVDAEVEIVVVDHETTELAAHRVMDNFADCVVRESGPFNFSRLVNAGVARSTGEIVVLLNNDTEVLSPQWAATLGGTLSLAGVGAVGGLLLDEKGLIQHTGVALGMRGTADHPFRGGPRHLDSPPGLHHSIREVSAVTAACLAVRRDLFEALGGMDEFFQVHYQDVDFCLRVWESGQSVVINSNCVLLHEESSTRGPGYSLLDRQALIDRWSNWLAQDDLFLRGFERR